MSSDVFISYRRKDVDFVKELAAAFKEAGREVWVDWEDIPPGVSDFTREIRRGIEGANTMVAVLSPDFLDSEYCLNELAHAVSLNKRVIPIVHRPIDDSSIPGSIRAINWVYFTPHAGQTNAFPEAFAALNRAIDSDYDYLREHTRLLTRAQDWLDNARNASFLLSGAELDAAESWLATAAQHTPSAASIHTEFILASRKAQTRRQRRLLIGALVLLALAVIGLIGAVLAGMEARRQQTIAERRADETLSLAAASAAEDDVAAGDYLPGLTLAYYAATFIDQPPMQARQALSQIAYLPGTRYAFFSEIPADFDFYGSLKPGESLSASDQSGTTLQAEDVDTLSIQDADGQAIMQLHWLNRPLVFSAPQVYDMALNPAVIAAYNTAGYYEIPIALSPDHQYAAVGGEGGLRIVTNDESASIVQTLGEPGLPIDTLYYSQEGRYLVSRASSDLLLHDSGSREDLHRLGYGQRTAPVQQDYQRPGSGSLRRQRRRPASALYPGLAAGFHAVGCAGQPFAAARSAGRQRTGYAGSLRAGWSVAVAVLGVQSGAASPARCRRVRSARQAPQQFQRPGRWQCDRPAPAVHARWQRPARHPR